ncbi:flagellar hook-basal body protein [Fibrobacterota bacterium]
MALGFSSSINGIRAALTSASIRSNNVSNINTKGYKSRRIIKSAGPVGGPRISAVPKDLTQGSLTKTNTARDLAIDGPGYFQVEGSHGGKLYTRSITLQASADGLLTDSRGYAISGVSQSVNQTHEIVVEHDGSVFSRNEKGESVKIGKLLTANFRNPQGLHHAGGGLFETTVDSGPPIPVKGESKVLQGFKEMSNVDLAEQLTGQMIDEKTLAANANAIRTQDQMLGEIIDLKG